MTSNKCIAKGLKRKHENLKRIHPCVNSKEIILPCYNYSGFDLELFLSLFLSSVKRKKTADMCGRK